MKERPLEKRITGSIPVDKFWKYLAVVATLICPLLGQTAFAAISVSCDHPRQGQTIEVIMQSTMPLTDADKSKLEFNKQRYLFFPASNPKENDIYRYALLLSVPADLKPGTYIMHCDQDEKKIVVEDGHFVVQRISLPKSKDNFIESKGEKEAVEKAKATLSSDRFWDGVFAPPNTYRMSAGFGMRRIVNGKLLKDYFHSGLDYAAPLGAPVKAVASGKVVLAARWF